MHGWERPSRRGDAPVTLQQSFGMQGRDRERPRRRQPSGGVMSSAEGGTQSPGARAQGASCCTGHMRCL
jgi:hypothetical protein